MRLNASSSALSRTRLRERKRSPCFSINAVMSFLKDFKKGVKTCGSTALQGEHGETHLWEIEGKKCENGIIFLKRVD